MTQAGPLRWRSGAGWLILAGGGSRESGETEEVDGEILNLADSSQPVAYLPTAGAPLSQGEKLLEYYADLGGPRGYVVPIRDPSGARDVENLQLLASAGLVYIDDGDALELTRALWEGPALDALARAFARGAIVVGMGAGAAALGAWVFDVAAEAAGGPGWGWVQNALVAPRFTGASQAPGLRAALRERQGWIGLGIPIGSALVLGPEGQVHTVGEEEITVVLAR
jgi:cyanophycinase-like exopeptidase